MSQAEHLRGKQDSGYANDVKVTDFSQGVVARSKQLCDEARQEVTRSKELQKDFESTKQRLAKKL